MIKRQFIPSYPPSRGTCKVIWHAFRFTLMQRVKMKCSFDNWSQYNVCKGINFFFFFLTERECCAASALDACWFLFFCLHSYMSQKMSWQIPLYLLHNWHNWVAQISTAKPMLPVESTTFSIVSAALIGQAAFFFNATSPCHLSFWLAGFASLFQMVSVGSLADALVR